MPNIVYLIILLNLLLESVSSDTDFCKLTCQNWRGGQWVTDKNSACNCGKPLPNCVEITENREDFRKWVLDFHNEMRNKVALGKEARWPNKVGNMHAISYDHDLEYTAWCHQNKCIFEHDKCRRTPKFQLVGQNLMMGSGKMASEAEIKERLKLWYDEFNDLKLDGEHENLIDNFDARVFENLSRQNKQIGHITQFIWGVTTHVGCVRFFDEREKIFYLACNYGPAGNMQGSSMFKRGEPCTLCEKAKCNPIYRGLCGEVVLPIEPKDRRSTANCFQFDFLINFLLLLIVLCIYL